MTDERLARLELQATIDRLRGDGATNPVLLNALAAVGGTLVGEIAAPEFEGRLAADFVKRVRAHARPR